MVMTENELGQRSLRSGAGIARVSSGGGVRQVWQSYCSVLSAGIVAVAAAGCVGDGDGVGGAARGGASTEVEAELSVDEKAYVVQLGRAALEAYFDDGPDAALEVSVPAAPASMSKSGPRLYVTLRNAGELRASYSGVGDSFEDIIRSGVVRAIEDERFGGILLAEEVPTTRLEYNAIFEGRLLDDRTLEELAAKIEPGRHAFSFGSDGQSAFFKETVMITHNYTHEEAFQRLCAKAGLSEDCYLIGATTIERYRAEHWVEDEGEPDGYYELFRSHRAIRPSDVTREAVQSALRLNADYLLTHQTDSGHFDYLYQPHADSLAPEQNTVRQAGACYGASKAATLLGTDEHLGMAHRAIANLLARQRIIDDGKYIYWERSSLGLTALALLGLTDFEHESVGDYYKEDALLLARGIVGQQEQSGRLSGDFLDPAGDTESGQQFYPGEALLALARCARRWPEESWVLDALEGSFEYYRDFWREQGESAFVPWQAAAWANAYFLTEKPRYADFVFELMDWSVERQNLSSYGSWTKDDYGGALSSYTGTPPSFATATHSEPLPLAITVARSVGDTDRAARYAEVEKHALRFVLQLVITERETFYMPNPERSLGGVRAALHDNNVRIDHVQHAATAFTHALEYLSEEFEAWEAEEAPATPQ